MLHVRGSREIKEEEVKEAKSGNRSTESLRRLMTGIRSMKYKKIKGNQEINGDRRVKKK